jgi:hypothetical protein
MLMSVPQDERYAWLTDPRFRGHGGNAWHLPLHC